MRNKVFNTTFENMLRILLLIDTVSVPVNSDRLAALDFICIYGKKCKVLDSNLHGDNEFGFAEFANKREKVTEAIKLSVRNNFVDVEQGKQGFLYKINERGKSVVSAVQSPYAKSYVLGAKIVSRRFSNASDDEILQFISDRSTEDKEV